MNALSEPPLVVGTSRPDGLAALARQSTGERGCDIVEARFDLAMGSGTTAPPDLTPFFDACRQLDKTGSPILSTIRLLADGGRWTTDADRLSWFEQVLEFSTWVDIEVESAIAADVVRRAHKGGRRVIVSHHDFAQTPDTATLDVIAARARVLGADIVKIATMVNSLPDHDRLIDLQRRRRDESLALVGMGPLGTPLRTYLPCVGSRLTYGYLDQVAAPGQLHARELVRRLLTDCPAYARAHGGKSTQEAV
jgi:3-dehydroquinate dehydratase-1